MLNLRIDFFLPQRNTSKSSPRESGVADLESLGSGDESAKESNDMANTTQQDVFRFARVWKWLGEMWTVHLNASV
jgi:hypothetical protein